MWYIKIAFDVFLFVEKGRVVVVWNLNFSEMVKSQPGGFEEYPNWTTVGSD